MVFKGPYKLKIPNFQNA